MDWEEYSHSVATSESDIFPRVKYEAENKFDSTVFYLRNLSENVTSEPTYLSSS